jgi:hypothetical protein
LISAIPDDIRIDDQSFVSKIFASTQTLHSIQEAPLFAILNIMELDWLLSSEARDICQSGPSLQKHVRVVVPSQRQLKHLYRFIDALNFFKVVAVLELTNLQQNQNRYFP